MKPFAHQEKFKFGYSDVGLLAHECGTGKTICACLWLRDLRDFNALVICPKIVAKKWERELKDWDTKATVVTKEDFKKMPLREWSAIVVDECDLFFSPLFVPKKRSQLSEALYNQRAKYPHTPLLMLSGTPVRSTPWNLHTALTFMGIDIPWKKWREEFFELQWQHYLPHPAYIAREDWREKIRPYIEKYCDIVLLRDCVADLPPVTETITYVKTPPFVRHEEDKQFFTQHRWEQQNKVQEIFELGRKYRKVLVIAFYTEQVDELAEKLKKDKPVFVIRGGVKNQEDIAQKAHITEDCYFIVQASVGVGWDGDSFSCVVFASMSYAVRDYVQSKARVRRIKNLHPVAMHFLIGGKCDKAILNNVNMGKDFVPSCWDD